MYILYFIILEYVIKINDLKSTRDIVLSPYSKQLV